MPTGDPSYVVSGGIVHLSGSMTNSTTNPDGFFAAIPSAVEPDSCVQPNVYACAYAGAVCSLMIAPALGAMWVADVGNGTVTKSAEFTSLAGISYPAAGAA